MMNVIANRTSTFEKKPVVLLLIFVVREGVDVVSVVIFASVVNLMGGKGVRTNGLKDIRILFLAHPIKFFTIKGLIGFKALCM